MFNSLFFRSALVVYRKEMRDALRDKRSLRMAFLMPLYFVALFAGGVVFTVNMMADKKVAGVTSINVAVEGEQNFPELVAWLREQGANVKTISGDAYQQVKAKKLNFALIIPPEAKAKREKGETAPVWLVYDGADMKAMPDVGFVRGQFYAWSSRQGAINLMARGVAPDAATPVWLRENNIADEQKMSAYILASVPMTLLLAVFVGSVGFSADMTAGERERRSLESLLITPVSSMALFAGKWLTSLTLTICVLFIQLVLLAVAFRTLPFNQLGLRVDVNFLDMINIFWSLMSVAIFAVALQLSVATLAKSFKDAQTLLGLLVFLPMVPIMYTLFNPGAFYDWWLWVPVLGQTSVIKEIFLGGNVATYTFLKFWIVALLLMLPAFYLGARQLRKPKTIYG